MLLVDFGFRRPGGTKTNSDRQTLRESAAFHLGKPTESKGKCSVRRSRQVMPTTLHFTCIRDAA